MAQVARVSVAILALAWLSGCSTIIEGTSQQISVATTPSGARCVAEREGARIGVVDPTPGTLTVQKTKHDIIFKCSKNGAGEAVFINKSGTAYATAGNLIIGGLIGWGIDSATGSDNKYASPIAISLPYVVRPDGTPVDTPPPSQTTPQATSGTAPSAAAATPNGGTSNSPVFAAPPPTTFSSAYVRPKSDSVPAPSPLALRSDALPPMQPIDPSTWVEPGKGPRFSSNAVPFVSNEARTRMQTYDSTQTPKAMAIAENGAWTFRRASDAESAQRMALESCSMNAKRPCHLYAIDDYVVFKLPDSLRATSN
jgi:hypothetical protein